VSSAIAGTQLGATTLDGAVARIALAAALGLFLGLEREWSEKPAGIRTFSLISLLAAVFTVLDRELLLVAGALLVIAQGTLLGVRGLSSETAGLSLTTSVSMLVAYGVGALVARGFVIEGVTVAVLSSLLLVLKRELHRFAGGLSRAELRSATEFAILAFVIYPLLPATPVTLAVAGLSVDIEPRAAWLMTVAVAGIGIVNYAIVTTYGGRGIAVTGFFGGLASSTAVVGTMLDHVRQRPSARAYAVAAVVLADAAMAARNLAIVVAFTLSTGLLLDAAVPLLAVVLGSVAVAAATADWGERVEVPLDSPFSLRNALGFGAIFAAVILAGGLAEAGFGALGFYVTAALTGLVSSAGATSSAVLLYRTGSLDGDTAALAVLLATASSVVVKAALTAAGPDRRFAVQVTLWSGALLAVGGAVALVVLA
jgi:uncharacterized membrane protein (DUF4010 family)